MAVICGLERVYGRQTAVTDSALESMTTMHPDVVATYTNSPTPRRHVA